MISKAIFRNTLREILRKGNGRLIGVSFVLIPGALAFFSNSALEQLEVQFKVLWRSLLF